MSFLPAPNPNPPRAPTALEPSPVPTRDSRPHWTCSGPAPGSLHHVYPAQSLTRLQPNSFFAVLQTRPHAPTSWPIARRGPWPAVPSSSCSRRLWSKVSSPMPRSEAAMPNPSALSPSPCPLGWSVSCTTGSSTISLPHQKGQPCRDGVPTLSPPAC